MLMMDAQQYFVVVQSLSCISMNVLNSTEMHPEKWLRW